jgi:hypothetical protein
MTTATTAIRHGRAGYRNHGCRCDVCQDAFDRWNRDTTREKRYGRWQPYVDAEPVRQHARALIEAGVGWRRIAVVADVKPSWVTNLLYGKGELPPVRKIRPATAERILALPVTPAIGAPRRIPATGTARRIQALAALGWSITCQAQRIGWSPQNLYTIFRRKWVFVPTERAVRDMYDALSMQPAPAGLGTPSVLRAARKNGWFPPLAWDDETIDDPAAVPCLLPPVDGSDPAVDEWTVQHVMAGHEAVLDDAVRLELVRRLTAAGWEQIRIAPLVGRGATWVAVRQRALRPVEQ